MYGVNIFVFLTLRVSTTNGMGIVASQQNISDTFQRNKTRDSNNLWLKLVFFKTFYFSSGRFFLKMLK